MAKNLVINNVAVSGGGLAEMSCSIAIKAAADLYPAAEQDALRSFADALDAASRAYLPPVEELRVLESMIDKQQQITLATQVGKIFKIKDLT